MNTIVFNALNSNSGGGKSIRDSFLKLLNGKNLQDRYVVLAAQNAGLDFITNPNIEIIELPALYSRTMMAPLVYLFLLGRVIERVRGHVVINLGDLLIRTEAKQIFVFDWSYALDVLPIVWAEMKPRDRLIRKTKQFLLKRDFHRPDIVIAQTDIIKEMLTEKYQLEDVRVIGNAVTVDTQQRGDDASFNLPDGVLLLYPSVYYPHKNLEILLDVAELARRGERDYRIIVTVAPHTDAAQEFLDKITARKLDDIIINIGQVPLEKMPSLYHQCDALLMPTLLESFSIVYPEAMAYGLPVFTSDMWFAHSVCGEAAKYFDPLDAQDILRAVDEIMPDDRARQNLVDAGRKQLATFPDWEENFGNYMRMIDELLGRDASAG